MLQSTPRLGVGEPWGDQLSRGKERAPMEVVLRKESSVKKAEKANTGGVRRRDSLFQIRPGLLPQPSEPPCLVA